MRPLQGQLSRVEVAEVRFEGNHAFPDDSLARAIVTRQTECTSAFLLPFCWFGIGVQRGYLPVRELPRDQLRLRVWYRWRGYREAQVDTATSFDDEGRLHVRFLIREGRPVRVTEIRFEGAERFRDSGTLENLPLRRNALLNEYLLDATRDTIIHRLANLGYARADVLRSSFIPADDPYAARVTYEVAAGPLSRYGHISVSGNENLSESTILRMLQFRSGELFRVDDILDAQARLFNLEIIRAASVVPDLEAEPDSIIPVRVEVREGDPHRVRSGAGWSSAECLDVESRWTSRNFFGGARRLQIRGRVSNIFAPQFQDILCPQSGQDPFSRMNWLVSAELNQPWLFSTRNTLQTSLYSERQSLPDVFVREAVGLSVAASRSLASRTTLSLSFSPELTRLDAADILFCTNFLVCTPEDIGTLQGDNWLSPLGMSFSRDRTNNVLNPSRGYSLVLDAEHASAVTGSDYRYDRIIGEATRYARVPGTGVVLAGKLRAGWVGARTFGRSLGEEGTADVDVIHPQKRFYAGGANSVRGFAQNRLGPRVLAADLHDLLRPVSLGGAGCTPQEMLALTCDASPLPPGRFSPRPTGGTRLLEGSVEVRIPMGREFQLAAFTDFGQVWRDRADMSERPVEFTPGGGIRYLSPIGPIRVDVAYRFRGGERLSVVTTRIRPFDPATDREEDLLRIGEETIPFVASKDLALLRPRVLFGDSSPGSLQRFQFHISIGQAF